MEKYKREYEPENVNAFLKIMWMLRKQMNWKERIIKKKKRKIVFYLVLITIYNVEWKHLIKMTVLYLQCPIAITPAEENSIQKTQKKNEKE